MIIDIKVLSILFSINLILFILLLIDILCKTIDKELNEIIVNINSDFNGILRFNCDR